MQVRLSFYRAIKPVSFTFRSSSLEQPIYAGDVLKAIRSVVLNKVVGSFDLGGPQSLSRKALLQKSSELLGKSTRGCFCANFGRAIIRESI